MNLVIVESPSKGKTIEKYLGPGYKVMASFGHIRDLPVSKLGVDTKNNFEPTYVIPPKAKKVLASLKKEVAQADNLYLATDYDREGEAIAWHLISAIKPKKEPKRITFFEITKPAITEAIKKPRSIDLNLVDAQQARRVLDRLVGYKLSPFLWKKVAQGLSAGRVQSVAVRLIVEREREIQAFKPVEFWSVEALLSKDKQEFKAILTAKDGEKIDKLTIKSQEEASKYLDDLNNVDYAVSDIKKEEKKRYPSPPFTTSTLQQEAGNKLSFSAKQTMKLAQDLYEDGLITYMRTDSVQTSSLALKSAEKVIKEKYGSEYVLEKPRFFKAKTKNAQEAHEAIRPTDLSVVSESVKADNQHQKLYDLIWKRMIASQMKEAILDGVSIKIKAGSFVFSATGQSVKFDGFLKLFKNSKEEILPGLKVGEKLNLEKLEKIQHFTEPPARFSEGALIKELEKQGIGRPSTYAPTLATIQDRRYVSKEDGRFVPSQVGFLVNDLLVKHFPEIVDYNFTAQMENNLDQIAEGKLKWQPVIADFYSPFRKNLTEKMEKVQKEGLKEETDEICPQCGKKMMVKLGRFGKFLACSGFPDCKFTKPLLDGINGSKDKNGSPKEEIKEKCPKCNEPLALKEGGYGPFLACTGYPKCKFTKSIEVAAKVPCPSCGGKLLRRVTRKKKVFWGCASYPKCKTAFWDEPQVEKCPKCQSLVTLNVKTKKKKCSACDWKS